MSLKDHLNRDCYKCLQDKKQKDVCVQKIKLKLLSNKKIKIIKDKCIKNIELKFLNNEIFKTIKINGLENYKVSNKGRILNKKTNNILNAMKNNYGYIMVRLQNKINKKSILYRVHRLVGFTFLQNNNSDYNIIDHINRIRNDNRVENLRWCNSKINSNNTKKHTARQSIIINIYDDKEQYKNIIHKDIGDYSNYKISNYGRIINNISKYEFKTVADAEGYIISQIINVNKKRHLFRVHRLVCLLFCEKPENYNSSFVVNHIDENKSNNYYKNLEWVSTKNNIRHSLCKKVYMYDENNNLIKEFYSIINTCKYFNLKSTGAWIRKCIKTNRKWKNYYFSFIKK